MAARPLLRTSCLKTYLQEKLPELSRSPVLVFSSKATTKFVKPLNEFVQTFENSNKDLGLEVVSYNLASAFLTPKDIEDATRLVEDTGAGTVIGVGSGVVMDLVKSLPVGDKKYLIPGTTAAVFASSSQASLVLDMEQEILLSKETEQPFMSLAEPGTITPNKDCIVGCHSILLDASYRLPERVPDYELARWALSLDPLHQGMTSTSLHMATGLRKGQVRSAPLALAASLLPAFFSRASLFSFWASLLPGLAKTLHGKTIHRDKIPALADLADRPVSVETLVGHVQRNQQASNVKDLDLSKLEQILSISLMEAS